jgi:hypothetical protein
MLCLEIRSNFFWRTLIYNRTGDNLGEETKPDTTVGYSFEYWCMLSKLYLTWKWEQDPGVFYLHRCVLQNLMAPFVRIFDLTYGSQSFVVTEKGRIGWAPRTVGPGDAVVMKFLNARCSLPLVVFKWVFHPVCCKQKPRGCPLTDHCVL